MKSYEEILSWGYGGMNKEDLSVIQEYCKDKKVLEIGSYIGQSSYVACSVASEVYCVDAWLNGCPFLDERQQVIYREQNEDIESKFDNNLKEFIEQERCKKLKGLTTEVSSQVPDNYFDVLILDADHTFEGTKRDYNLFLSKLRIGGLIIFHDYDGAWEGVTGFVDSLKLPRVAKKGYCVVLRKTE